MQSSTTIAICDITLEFAPQNILRGAELIKFAPHTDGILRHLCVSEGSGEPSTLLQCGIYVAF